MIREALSIFPDGPIEDNVERQDFMKRVSKERLAGLDDRFYELLGGEEQSMLARQCAAYVARHPEEFFTDA